MAVIPPIDGIDYKKAIEYCGDDTVFEELLGQFYITGANRIENLRSSEEDGNLVTYQIAVHSTKSACKMIGAIDLFKKASELEHAALSKNFSRIKKENPFFLMEMKNLQNRIGLSLGPEKIKVLLERQTRENEEEAERQEQMIGDMVSTDELASHLKNKAPKEELPKTVIRKHEGKRRLLLVDDDGMTLKSLMFLLGEQYEVDIANSSQHAFAACRNSRPDLILLDYEMPGLDGRATLRLLRANPDTKDIPVMILTGVTDKDRVQAILNMHPDAYLLKTLGKSLLIKKIDEFFEHKEQEEA